MAFDESHPAVNISTENIVIWRYMDIPSFLSLITERSLTFVRADLFEDKYEGKLPIKTALHIDEITRQEIENGITDKSYWNFSKILNENNGGVYINCWCNENHEMVHMWKIYSKENGLAIQTDYSTLKESFETNEIIYPSQIKYIDFENEYVDWKSNSLITYSIKRKEYKSENEFRLMLAYPREIEDKIILDGDVDSITRQRKKLYLTHPVVKCKVNPQLLIKKILISPYAPNWYLDIIKNIIKKYNINIEVLQSKL